MNPVIYSNMKIILKIIKFQTFVRFPFLILIELNTLYSIDYNYWKLFKLYNSH
jgi:hypothetical protein